LRIGRYGWRTGAIYPADSAAGATVSDRIPYWRLATLSRLVFLTRYMASSLGGASLPLCANPPGRRRLPHSALHARGVRRCPAKLCRESVVEAAGNVQKHFLSRFAATRSRTHRAVAKREIDEAAVDLSALPISASNREPTRWPWVSFHLLEMVRGQ